MKTHTQTIFQKYYKHSVVVSPYCMKKLDTHLYDTSSCVIRSILLLAQLPINCTKDTQQGCVHTNIITLNLDGFLLQQSACSLLTATCFLFWYDWLCCVQSSHNNRKWRWRYILLTNQQTDQLIPRSRILLGTITALQLVNICVLTDLTTCRCHEPVNPVQALPSYFFKIHFAPLPQLCLSTQDFRGKCWHVVKVHSLYWLQYLPSWFELFTITSKRKSCTKYCGYFCCWLQFPQWRSSQWLHSNLLLCKI